MNAVGYIKVSVRGDGVVGADFTGPATPSPNHDHVFTYRAHWDSMVNAVCAAERKAAALRALGFTVRVSDYCGDTTYPRIGDLK